MRRYILRRLVIAIPVLLAVTVVTFLFANFAPGDPIQAMVRPGADIRPQEVERIKESLGLNKPLHERYLAWLSQVVQGNLGATFQSGQSVVGLITNRLPNTIKLMGTALIISVILGVLLGIFSAFRQGSKVDNVLTVVVFTGISLPSYLIALFVVYFFVILIKNWTGFTLFPTGGSESSIKSLPQWADELWHLVLPAAVLAFGLTATFLRYTRASVLEAMRQDYVTTARSKGLSERAVRFGHILRNALLPVVTVIGLVLPVLVTGALFVETIFSWPGIGSLAIWATQNREYNVIMGIALLTAVMIVLSNLATDIAYAFIDPRIRYS